ncbi:MAG: DegT/DnrJ/EryC1/StrS family aminotransferase [bacterium]|nr:DegT/DnrJ/EryC1/StrS family aminotransferase [bacterium]
MPSLALLGGPPACTVNWPTWPVWDDSERRALLDVLDSGKWWYGARVQQFERAFAAFHDAEFGITTTSGTTALETALLALGIGAGDEVIVPPYTFLATASAVLRVNAVPVFADIQPHTLCLDPDDVERKISPKTKAIIPVHLAGHVADMDRFSTIARQHNLYVIEDACHAWGSQWRGKGVGALGDCGVFSFQASKNITSAEGGIILTNNAELARECRSYVNCGRREGKPWYEHFLLGSNLRMTEFQAALLLAQLSRLPAQNERRAANAQRLFDGLRDLPALRLIQNDPRITRRAYHFFPFRLDLAALQVSRARFKDALAAEGVPTMIGYDRPLYKNPLFQRTWDRGPASCPISCPFYGLPVDYTTVHCPVCEAVVQDTLWLFHTILLAEPAAIDALIAAILKLFDHLDELRS